MEDMIREYLSMQQIQELVKQGVAVEYTGWHVNNGYEYQHEVRYIPVTKPIETHGCIIFELVKIGDDTYRCQVCGKTYNQEAFEKMKQSTPVRFCSCGGNKKPMDLYIPYPVSGYETHAIFCVCNFCSNKYMYYRDRCQNENCDNTCDRSEVYCYQCQNKADKA